MKSIQLLLNWASTPIYRVVGNSFFWPLFCLASTAIFGSRQGFATLMQRAVTGYALKKKAQAVLHDVYIVSTSIAMHGAVNGTTKKHSLDNGVAFLHASLDALQNPEAPLKSLYPPSPLKFVPTFPEGKSEIENESITNSPALARFAIFTTEGGGVPSENIPSIKRAIIFHFFAITSAF